MKISELLQRYNLKSRKSLYSRLNGLEITLDKDEIGHSYATEEQIELLDQLDQYLKAGGTIATFTPISTTEVVPQHTPEAIPQPIAQQGVQHTSDSTEIDDRLEALLRAIANVIQPPSPLSYMRELEEACQNEWLLTTSEVRDLIGVKPKTKKGEDTYKRGSWIFVKSGKIGGQTAWRVTKDN